MPWVGFMSRVRFLGAHGGQSLQAQSTCLQVSDTCVIDAGNLMTGLEPAQARTLTNVFLTHAHLDHIVDLAFFLDHYYAERSDTLHIYGLPETLSALKTHFFNDVIWPDFTQIMLANQRPSLVLQPIALDAPVAIDSQLTLTAVWSNHSVACCGFVIESDQGALLFGADSWKNPAFWHRVNQHQQIHAVVVDVSFPDRLRSLAYASYHLTPTLLAETLTELTRPEVKVYAWHLKPAFLDEIQAEWQALGFEPDHVLQDGDTIDLASGLKYSPKNQHA